MIHTPNTEAHVQRMIDELHRANAHHAVAQDGIPIMAHGPLFRKALRYLLLPLLFMT